MKKTIIFSASILGTTSIILGAFGAHALKELLNPMQLNSFDTAVKYQMYHAIFLLIISQFNFLTNQQLKTIFTTTISGIFLFSGSIYLLSTNHLTTINFKFLGPITPIGGIFLVVSWLLLTYYSVKKSNI